MFLCLCGCSPQSSPTSEVTSAPATPSAPAGTPTTLPEPPANFASSRPPYAVLLHISGVGEPYYIEIDTGEGLAGPMASAKSRSEKRYYLPPSSCPAGGMCVGSETAAYNLPEVSISLTRVYFLDGDTSIKSLTPDGAVQTVMDVSAPPNTQVVFAVSPDDTRIAVATITLATANVADSFHEVMYVEDVGTAANRVDIYSSTTQAEWPLAWHAGKLIVGLGPQDIGAYNAPYGAIAYHVVDPSTGRRLAALDCAQGLLSPAGTACVSGFCPTWSTCSDGTVGKEAYDGSKTMFALRAASTPRILTAFAHTAALSPDGTRLAATVLPADPNAASDDTVLIGDGTFSTLTSEGATLGWLDDRYVVVTHGFWAYVVDTSDASSVLRILSQAPVPQAGFPTLAGVLPTNLV